MIGWVMSIIFFKYVILIPSGRLWDSMVGWTFSQWICDKFGVIPPIIYELGHMYSWYRTNDTFDCNWLKMNNNLFRYKCNKKTK